MKYSHPDIHFTIKNDEGKFSFILPRRDKVAFSWLDYAIPLTMVSLWLIMASMVLYYAVTTEASPLWAVFLSVAIVLLFIQGYLIHKWSSPSSYSVVRTVNGEWWQVCQKVKNIGIISSSMKDKVYDESVYAAQEMLYRGIVHGEVEPVQIDVYCDEVAHHMSKIKAIESSMLNSWKREDL